MVSGTSLSEYLICERITANKFLGQTREIGFGGERVFGGQILGQATRAAQQTVPEDRRVHSLHGYFLRIGDSSKPINYSVDASRDGRTFSTREVSAVQDGKKIFSMSTSFHIDQDGLEYRPKVTLPLDILERINGRCPRVDGSFQSDILDIYVLNQHERTEANAYQMWVKTRDLVSAEEGVHRAMMAYLSDIGMLMSMALPHEPELGPMTPSTLTNYFVASLDHSMWFHREVRVDDWMFFDCRVETTGAGRGLSFARVYDRQGALIANVSQEGILRKRVV